MRRRVVVTGMGCVTPVGNDVPTLWQSLLTCKSGVAYTTLFDASGFPTKISAEVKNFNIADYGENPAEWEGVSRHTRFAVAAAIQAVKDSGLLDRPYDPTRFGVYFGSGEGQQDFDRFTKMVLAGLEAGGESVNQGRFAKKGLEVLHPMSELEQNPSLPAAYLAGIFNAQGPNANCLTACAASSQAIGEAVEMIRRGDADYMLSGGAHSMIHQFGVTGFNLLTALSTRNDEPTRASRPFDLDRDGFVLGEGASVLVLEEYEHAKKRGAQIYGEITGYGLTADAFRITDSHPEGRGAIRCIQMALGDAGVSATGIHYINAHGTSTDVNDKVETLAIKSVLGEQAYKTPVSSTKSMTGHMIAAAGATELIICLLAIKHGVLPPTINYETPDPNCDLDYIPNQPRELRCDVALSNSFGFGGQNTALVVSRLK